jgi:uncharacterized protein (TIGR02246 family)
MLRLTGVMLVVLLGALAGCATSRNDESAVRELVARLVRAVNEANADEFLACFDANATAFFPSSANASRRVGREAIRAAITPTFNQGPPATPVVPRDLAVSVHRDVAYVTFDGGAGSMHARRTFVLRRMPDGWIIVHLHASNVSE